MPKKKKGRSALLSMPRCPSSRKFAHTSMTHQVFASTPKQTTHLIATTWVLETVTSVLLQILAY